VRLRIFKIQRSITIDGDEEVALMGCFAICELEREDNAEIKDKSIRRQAV